jgi:hypothetical protein
VKKQKLTCNSTYNKRMVIFQAGNTGYGTADVCVLARTQTVRIKSTNYLLFGCIKVPRRTAVDTMTSWRPIGKREAEAVVGGPTRA